MVSGSPGRGVMRIAEVLNCFTVEEPVHNLTGISRRIGLAKSTTHRLLHILVSEGFLMPDAYGRGYRLGYQMLHWGMVAQSTLDLRNEALPILGSLAKDVNETAILTVRNGMSSLCVAIIESSQPVRLIMQAGTLQPLHAGAQSKALLAFLPEAESEQIINSLDLVRLASNTITDPEGLRREMAAIRQRGYAMSFEETDPGAMGLAAPVYDYSGQAVAGIGIAAPITRIPPERATEVAAFVLDAGRELSARLGAPGPHDIRKV